MLPEALSNGICSLNPGVDRLTKTVVIDFDAHGHVAHTAFDHSVIRSAARLTYTDLKRVLVERDASTRSRLGDIVPMLELMEALCAQLRQRRHARGSIDFDLPEAEIVLDLTGRPEAIVRAERHIGHQIIEEFMLAANEAVARYLMRHKVPLLHRVHEPPDADHVSELARFLTTFGVRLTADPAAPSPRDFQQALEAVAGRPEERLINTVLLRAMKQARYAAEALGHFGLATGVYTHFTSPIRRYPDLVVHRLLGQLTRTHPMPLEEREAWAARLPAIAEATSRRERVAMDAERTVVALKKVQFMQDKIGEEFPGFISGVQPFGFFVELRDYFIDGLVHIATLTDDHYELQPRAHLLRGRRIGTVYRLGDAVIVRVVAANPERQRIDFQLLSAPPPRAPVEHRLRAPRRRSVL
jgi:ribonuclease R